MFHTGLTKREVRVTSGTQGPDGLRLQIEDESSSTLLAEIKLTPELIWEMVRGGTFKIEAEQSSHLERVGKTMENDQIPVPAHMVRKAPYGDLSSIEEWARAEYPGWESYAARRLGGAGGAVVIVRRWV